MKKLFIILVVVTLASGIVFLTIPSDEDVAQNFDQVRTHQAKISVGIEPSDAFAIFDLDATSTRIDFSCAKTVAGKTTLVHGGWSERFGSTLSGNVILDRETQFVKQIEIDIHVGSLWSEHEMLTEALLTEGFFEVDQHPMATFVSTDITEGAPTDTTLVDATHTIEGNFKLNGIEKSIRIPAKIELGNSKLAINSQFSLNRHEFSVAFADRSGFGLLKDENISNLVAVRLSIDARKEAETQQEATESIAPTQDSVANVESADVPRLAEAYTETIPVTQITFEMVLVPGNTQQDISSLYFGKHEVTWDEFMPWVDGRDVKEEIEMGELRALKLRPSPPYGSVDRNFGMSRRPVLGISRQAAELYCQWLSEQTGKQYRLPTEAEWEHAYRSGGGDTVQAPSAEYASRHSVYKDSSFDESVFGWATKRVGSMQPDELGLHDMAGNVCEWVTGTGEERVVRGGHYESPREELGVGRYIQDASWNRDDPSEPKSTWWFVNAPWAGFRVVCEIGDP